MANRVDYSLLRFKTSLTDAKKIFNPQSLDYGVNQYNQVLLRPNEAYFQITNFSQNYFFTVATGMFVVDCNGSVLEDVTANTDFILFTDGDGFKQIAYEVGFLDFNFYSKTVHLKMVTDTCEFFSAPLNISNSYNHQYVRVEYLYYGISFELGIDFSIEQLSGKYQTIGLRALYNDIEVKRSDKGYVQMSTGLEVTSKALDTTYFKFKCEYSSPFSILQSTRIFSADVIYIGWGENLPQVLRVTNKPSQESGERLGESNLKKNDFSCCLDLADTKIWTPQLLAAFDVIDRYPLSGYYSVDTFAGIGGSLASLRFNRSINPASLNPGYTFKLFKDDVLVLTIPSEGFASDGASFMDIGLPTDPDLLQINISDTWFTENGIYDFVVDPLYDEFGGEWGGYATGEWRIILADGEFDQNDFDPTEFLTDAI